MLIVSLNKTIPSLTLFCCRGVGVFLCVFLFCLWLCLCVCVREQILGVCLLVFTLINKCRTSIQMGARCSSVVRAFDHDEMGRRIDPSWGGPIELFLVPASAPRLV